MFLPEYASEIGDIEPAVIRTAAGRLSNADALSVAGTTVWAFRCATTSTS